MSGFNSQSNIASSRMTLLQTVYTSLGANTSITGAGVVAWPSTTGTTQDLLTQTITTSAGTKLLISFACVAGGTTNALIFFRIVVDSNPTTTPSGQGAAAGIPSYGGLGCSINLNYTGLAAGSHTIRVQWRTAASGNTAQINPFPTPNTNPDNYSASLITMEVAI